MAQFENAVKLRKRVNGAAQLYRALLLLSVIGAVIFGIIALVTFASSASSSRTRAELIPMVSLFVFSAAVSVLYYFAWRATARSQRWAPLTMLILFLIGVAINLLSMGVAVAAGGSNAPVALAGGVLGMILPAVFAVVSWKAYAAIPTYLKQPAWCQELIVKANL